MTKEERRRKRKPLPEPEHTLLATVKSVTVSFLVRGFAPPYQPARQAVALARVIAYRIRT
ncbi:hypothetical protein [Bradyrhizobium tropiciagri]|uniref:hypothetical protein n=1 Tax=Bradyrhizobium tropiciagri TaxID=312253 RepID=UPI000A7107E9|nr:hypothetical protein [Bradyrhizobium tropiciagri]